MVDKALEKVKDRVTVNLVQSRTAFSAGLYDML